MKKFTKLAGIIALAVVMVSLTGCEDVVSVTADSLPALTGTVSISGAAQVGETLTVNTNLGGSGAIFFQWQRIPANGGEWADIAGATASNHTLQTADVGHAIRVVVTRSDNSGSVTSTRTATVIQPFTGIDWIAIVEPGTPTPSITLAFNGFPTGLVVADITIAPGTGSATGAALSATGIGNTQTLTLTGVTAGTVYISIDRAGVTSGPRQVTLVGPISWTVAADPGAPTPSITLTFDDFPMGLVATDITVASGTGAATRGALSAIGNTRTLTLFNVEAGTVHISINRAGIASGPETVTLVGPVSWTATVASSTQASSINFTFSSVPTGLVVTDITVAPGTGSATRGNLTGTGNTRTLTLFNVVAGTIYISINRAGIAPGPQQVLIGIMTPPVGGTLGNQLSWVRGFGQSGNHYLIQISGNQTISVANAELPANRNITFMGTTQSNITGTFTVPSGAILTLGANIAITGTGSRGVTVNSGGTLVMNAGSAITGNSVTGAGAQGGGVLVNSGGTLIMNAGSRIAGNTVSDSVVGGWTVTLGGGGVRVNSGGTFTMNGGEISGNTSTAVRSAGTSGNLTSQGGGVSVGGTFTMNGGEISGNTATANRTGGSGGTMLSEGGGVFVSTGSTFAMNGGGISGNVVTAFGPGGTLTSRGGGVRVAPSIGAGTGVNAAGIFRISGGIVRGNDAAVAAALRNTSGDGVSASISNAGTAQRGTWVGNNFTSLGTINTTNVGFNVVNGNLQW